jgi:serine/threonine-protein kinase PpkA
MSQSQPLLLIPGYRIERELGKGAMATAYLAIQESLEREVALKIMAPMLVADQSFHERFLTEGKIIARLNHPNIVNVYDIGITDQAIYYMALEYAREGNLTGRMRHGLSVQESLQILKQVASALHYAHLQGVVHRDVKPQNILFRDQETALLSDFGIAKALDSLSEMTAAGWVIGTPAYMSPEQAMGHRVSPQSDLFSLGIVFYEMLTGKKPRKSEDSVYAELPQAKRPIPQLPTELAKFQHVLNRLLAANPMLRYADANELIHDIQTLENRAEILHEVDKTRVKTSGKAQNWRNQPVDQAAPRNKSDTSGEISAARQPIDSSGIVSGQLGDPSQPISNDLAMRRDDLLAQAGTKKRRKPASRWGKGLLALAAFAVLSGVIYWLVKPSPQELPSEQAQLIRIDGPTFFTREKDRYLRGIIDTYQKILELEPDHQAASEALAQIADEYATLAEVSWKNLDESLTINLIYEGLRAVPDHPGLLALRKKIVNHSVPDAAGDDARRHIWQWIREADEQLAESRFVMPLEDNAVASYRKVLQIDPHNEIAQRRLDDMASVFRRQAQSLLEQGEIASAVSYIEQGLFISPLNPALLELQKRIEKPED